MDYVESHSGNKALVLDYDFIRSLDTDQCLFCLSTQEVSALLVICEYLGWRTRWRSPSGVALDNDWIDAFRARIEAELMTDHCDLAAAITDIQNNITTINANVTTINADITTINTNITNVQTDIVNVETNVSIVSNKVENIYNNLTIINVQNNVILTFGGSTADRPGPEIYARYNALCTTIGQWMKAEIRAVLTALAASPTDLATLDLQIDTLFQQTYLQMSTGSSYPYTAATIFAASQDSSAMDDVACAILTGLLPLTMSYQAFITMFTGYSPPAYPDNRYIITLVLTQAFNFLDAYTTFQSMLAAQYSAELALAPTAYSCSFCGVPASFDVDFTKGQKWPFIVRFGQSEGLKGLRTQIVYSQADGYNVHRLMLELEFPTAITISTIDIAYQWTTDNEGEHPCNFPHVFHEAQFDPGTGCPAHKPDDGGTYTNNFTATNDGLIHTANIFTGTYTNPCRLTILIEDCQRAYLREIHIH